MLFNSIEFLIFLPITFFLFWFVFNKKINSQNLLIIVVSYVFYGWWDWRFLSLIILSSITDFHFGRLLEKHKVKKQRKLILYLSVFVNIGLLGFFKYFNFFIDSFIIAFEKIGIELHSTSLNVILPVGISFYTFQTLSYSIDVYRKKIKATNNPIAFFAFVSFFPQLVAGPIERASNLLPQFLSIRSFNYYEASDGLRQIIWGFFKKIVIADNAAIIVNQVFDNPHQQSTSMLIIGVVFFAFQIYGDFSGYSDIAIGLSKLFGFKLMQNFAYPYFSRDIAEFWRRWHISLSSWFRDYLYIPLGGSRGSSWMKIRNVILIFTISGFWHGSNWTFVIWGLLNGIFFLPLILLKKNRINLNTVAENSIIPSFMELFKIFITFLLVCFTWIFFRAENIEGAIDYISLLFFNNGSNQPDFDVVKVIFFICILLIVEWTQRNKTYGLEFLTNKTTIVRWVYYFVILFTIILTGSFSGSQFIYFQF